MGRASGHDGERGRWGSDSFTLGTVSVPPQGDGCGAAAGYLRIPVKSITHSDGNRSPIPTEIDHPFRRRPSSSERAARDLGSPAHRHDERGGGGRRGARAPRPARPQDNRDGGPLRAGGGLAGRGRAAGHRCGDGGGDGGGGRYCCAEEPPAWIGRMLGHARRRRSLTDAEFTWAKPTPSRTRSGSRTSRATTSRGTGSRLVSLRCAGDCRPRHAAPDADRRSAYRDRGISTRGSRR